MQFLIWCSLLASVYGTEGEEDVQLLNEIEMISVLNYEYYMVPRMRWGELNQISGFRSSEKLFNYKTVQTGLGEMNIPVEDPKKLRDLSPSELVSVMQTKVRVNLEDDSNLGLELVEEGEYDDALTILHDVLKQTEKQYGKDHVLYGNALADLGWAHFLQKHFETAMDYYRQALDADIKHQTQYGSRNYAASANMLAICAMKAKKGNILAISNVLEKAFDSLLKASDTERFKILLNMANIYLSARMPIRAIAILKLARHVLKKANSDLVADVYVFLGTAYIMRQEYTRATKLLEIAKTGLEGQKKQNTNYYVEALYQLANVKLMTGSPTEAFNDLSKVKDVYEQLHGSNTIESALILSSMAQALKDMGQVEKAIMFLETSSTIASQDSTAKTGLVDLRISALLSDAYMAMGKTNKLKSQLESTIAMGTHLFNENHPIVTQYKTSFDRVS